jgi:hypothetical protein
MGGNAKVLQRWLAAVNGGRKALGESKQLEATSGRDRAHIAPRPGKRF